MSGIIVLDWPGFPDREHEDWWASKATVAWVAEVCRDLVDDEELAESLHLCAVGGVAYFDLSSCSQAQAAELVGVIRAHLKDQTEAVQPIAHPTNALMHALVDDLIAKADRWAAKA